MRGVIVNNASLPTGVKKVVELVGFEPTSGQVGDKLSTCVVTY